MKKNPVAHYHYDGSGKTRKHTHFGGGVFHEHDKLHGYGITISTLKRNDDRKVPSRRGNYFGRSTSTRVETSTAMNPKKKKSNTRKNLTGTLTSMLAMGTVIGVAWWLTKKSENGGV